MRRYPVNINLRGKRCLVVGAGKVGIRKIRGLLECGPELVTVLDTAAPSPELIDACQRDNVRCHHRPFEARDLDGVFLTVAATSNAAVNREVARLCEERSILCNVADHPELSSFIVPATVRRGELTLAISTGGASPALSKVLRKKLESLFGPEYEQLLAIMALLRPRLLELGLSSDDNADIFRALVHGGLIEDLAHGELDSAADMLRENLPEELHPIIGELLNAVA